MQPETLKIPYENRMESDFTSMPPETGKVPNENGMELGFSSMQSETGKFPDENGMGTAKSHALDSQNVVDGQPEFQSVEELDRGEHSWDNAQHSSSLICSSLESPPPNLEHEGLIESREEPNAVSIQTHSGDGDLGEVSEELVYSVSGDRELEEVSEGLLQSHECGGPPARGSDSVVESDEGSPPHAHTEVVFPTTTTGESKSASEVNGVCEAFVLHTSTGNGHQRMDSVKLPSEGNNGTGLVSTVVEEWQRFDIDMDESTLAGGSRHTPLGGCTRGELEIWELLLEDGSSENNVCNVTSQAEAEVGVDSLLHDRIPFCLASPGNPFVENLDRVSNFSEAEGFAVNGSLQAHGFEAETSLPVKGGPLHTEYGNEGLLPGMSYTMPSKPGEEDLSGEREHGSKRQWQARFPSFSDIRSSPKSFVTSVSALETSKDECSLEGAGEKWEAVFDSPPSSAHEVGRSFSLPRVAGERRGKMTDFSIFSKEGRYSPKLSPLVKKFVSKIRTTPDRVPSTVQPVGTGSKDTDKKEPKTPMWRSFLCCSHT